MIFYGTQMNADFQDRNEKKDTNLLCIVHCFFCVHQRKSASKIKK